MPTIYISELRRERDQLTGLTLVTLIALVAVIGLGVYAGLGHFKGNVEGDWFGEILKISLAIGDALVIYTFGHWLFKGVARLEPRRRRFLAPTVLFGLFAILNISSYVMTVEYGQNIFATEAMRQAVEQASRDKDIVTTGLQRFGALAADAQSCADEFKGMAKREQGGAYSGYPAQSGPLISYFDGLAEQCASVVAAIEKAGGTTTALVARMNDGLQTQQEAAADSKTAVEARALAMRSGSEMWRDAVVEASGKLPIGVVEGLANSLLGAQAEPALSSKAKVAEGQKKGIAEARVVLEKYGRQFLAKIGDLSRLVNQPPQVFVLAGPAELPIRYWYAGVPIIAMAIAMDGMIFLIYVLAAGINDAIRDHELANGPDEFEKVTGSIDAVRRLEMLLSERADALGPHAYPQAARARYGAEPGSAKPRGGNGRSRKSNGASDFEQAGSEESND
jgi:hypothetical protein